MLPDILPLHPTEKIDNGHQLGLSQTETKLEKDYASSIPSVTFPMMKKEPLSSRIAYEASTIDDAIKSTRSSTEAAIFALEQSHQIGASDNVATYDLEFESALANDPTSQNSSSHSDPLTVSAEEDSTESATPPSTRRASTGLSSRSSGGSTIEGDETPRDCDGNQVNGQHKNRSKKSPTKTKNRTKSKSPVKKTEDLVLNSPKLRPISPRKLTPLDSVGTERQSVATVREPKDIGNLEGPVTRTASPEIAMTQTAKGRKSPAQKSVSGSPRMTRKASIPLQRSKTAKALVHHAVQVLTNFDR